MAYTVKKVLEIARNEIGYKEKASNSQLDNKTANAGKNNWTKYARDLAAAGYYNGNKNGYAWCDVFHDWVHYMAAGKNAKLAQEVTYQSGPYGAGCKWSALYYKQAGRFYTSGPKAGDQIFFGKLGNEEHTGIVEAVNGNIVTTIEGNTSNQVVRRTYSINDKYIVGYGRPKYDPEPVKTIQQIAQEVLDGKWGNGTDRKNRLIAAGYDYSAVQKAVNQLVAAKNKKKSVEEIAKEVLDGKWGNGATRKQKLEAAGYNYAEVQRAVNTLLANKGNSSKKTVEEIAKEVIAGRWGNGLARRLKLKAAGYNYAEVQRAVNKLLG